MRSEGKLRNFLTVIQNKTLDFVAHGFFARFAEMDFDAVGGFSDFLYHNRLGASFAVRGEAAAVAVRLVVLLFIGSPFHEKSPHADFAQGLLTVIFRLKWQSGKVSGFCHLDFAISLFKGVIPCRADTL